jgi:hypothetical protein
LRPFVAIGVARFDGRIWMIDQTPEERDVLLIAADLSERRLLLGELLEAGYDVLPLPGVAIAMGTLLQNAIAARLILLDVQGDEHATPTSVERLAAFCPGVPFLLIVGALDRAIWQPLEKRIAVLVHRPITIGQIVERVRGTISPAKRQ